MTEQEIVVAEAAPESVAEITALAQQEQAQTSAATIVMGDTKSGKTSLLATFAEWVYERFGKITRLYSTDPGGYGDFMQALINSGVVEVYRVRTRDPMGQLGLTLETMAQISQGYWPAARDPKTGVAEPGVELVAPRSLQYTVSCPKGHLVKKVKTSSFQPSPCGKCTPTIMVGADNAQVSREIVVNQGFEQVGALCFDGFTSSSDWVMTEMGARAAKNELGGEKAAINTLQSGNMKFGSGNRAAVGLAQTIAQTWVQNSNSVAGLVAPPIWTALELRVTDDRTNLPVYGPKIAGNAKTPEIPSWFGNCLGVVDKFPGEKGPERRLYLQSYQMPGDPTPHVCGNRAMNTGLLPVFLTDAPGEAPFTHFNLGHFFQLLHDLSLAAAEKRVAERFGGRVPGIGSGRLGGGAGGGIGGGVVVAREAVAAGVKAVGAAASAPQPAQPAAAALQPAAPKGAPRAVGTPPKPKPAGAPQGAPQGATAAPAVAAPAVTPTGLFKPQPQVAAPAAPGRPAGAPAPGGRPMVPPAAGPKPPSGAPVALGAGAPRAPASKPKS